MSFLILAAVGFEARGGTRVHFNTSLLELNLQKQVFNKFQYTENLPSSKTVQHLRCGLLALFTLEYTHTQKGKSTKSYINGCNECLAHWRACSHFITSVNNLSYAAQLGLDTDVVFQTFSIASSYKLLCVRRSLYSASLHGADTFNSGFKAKAIRC